jgi:hypothetical protein
MEVEEAKEKNSESDSGIDFQEEQKINPADKNLNEKFELFKNHPLIVQLTRNLY